MTLPDLLGIGDANEYELYDSMDWLQKRQGIIEKKLAKRRKVKREALLEATATELDKVRRMIDRGRLQGKKSIGDRVGKVLKQFKVAKLFVLRIEDGSFDFEVNQQKVNAEATLDGIDVVRTSVAKQTMDADQAVRSYKQLSSVERAFRRLKIADLMVRPIRHRLEDRVHAHILLSVLA